MHEKAYEQRTIIDQHLDVKVLKRAIASFTSLQLVQLLRWTEYEDRIVLDYLNRNEEARRTVNLDWALACSHAGHTVGIALLAYGNAEPNRFILPFASPAPSRDLAVVWRRKGDAGADARALAAVVRGLAPVLGVSPLPGQAS